MRVATNTFPNSLVDQLGNLSYSQSKLQLQASSGQRITTADDDPTAMREVLDMQAEARSVSQYQTNVASQQDTASANYSVIKSLVKVSSRANEISTLVNGLQTPQDLANYATEIDQLMEQSIQWANTKNGNTYLFAGTDNDQPPFVAVRDANGSITGVTYQGNESTNQTEISEGTTISAQITGANTSGIGSHGLITDSASGADFFAHMIAFRDNLKSGNVAGITTTDVAALRKDEDNFLYHVGLNGVTQSRLDSATTALKDRSQALNSQVSNQASSNIAETAVRLTQTQTAYQAALQSSSKIMSMSLMDYLR